MVPKITLKDSSVYVDAYFRIEAGYIWGQGMDKDKVALFYAEVQSVLTGIGFTRWEGPRPSVSPKGFRGEEGLYCHPMDLSGTVKKESVEEIKEAISHAKTFRLRAVDLYDERYNFTEDELRMELEAHKERLEQKILTLYSTKRRNLFKRFFTNEIRSEIRFFKHRGMGKIEGEFMQALFEELLRQGKIIKSEHLNLYRARTKNDPPIAA